MVVPAVAISTLLGALNGYVLTKWRFPGHKLVFGLMLFACFIPFQAVLIPMATIWHSAVRHRSALGRHFGIRPEPRPRPRRLRPRLHDAVLPQLLRGVPDRTDQGRADRRRELLPDLPPHPAAELGADHRRDRDLPVHQHLERLSLRRLLRRPATTMPMTVALNNVVNTSTGVRRIQRQHGRRDDRRPADAPRLRRRRTLLRARPDGRRGQRMTPWPSSKSPACASASAASRS